MNKIILSVLIFLFSMNGFTQEGVKFMEGSFQETLNVAKQQKKMVFVDERGGVADSGGRQVF